MDARAGLLKCLENLPGVRARSAFLMPVRHVRRVCWAIGVGSKEAVVVIGIDVMHLHHPHQLHRIGGAGKAAVGGVDVVADRLGAGEPFGADTDGTGAMLDVRDASSTTPWRRP